MIKLYPYQLEIGQAIADSIMNEKGETFSVEIARQGGKNELSAQLEVALLLAFAEAGGNIVKCSPTFKPQTITSIIRLKERLAGWGMSQLFDSSYGYMVALGNARCIFFSADESANVVGATAHILLEIDESQDVNKEKYSKEFKPMGATTNVTTVHYGTTWDDSTLLEEVKQMNLELERKDGIRRHFRYDWREVAKHNTNYGYYVERERDRLGADHPLFLTQYELVSLSGGGRFLNDTQRAQLQGGHTRHTAPQRGRSYIAGLDLAGEAEQLDDITTVAAARRDSTVLTIGEVSPGEAPSVNVVQQYQWTGTRHSDLYATLKDLLANVWDCQRITVDATGIGEPVASYLRRALGGRVEKFKFTQPSKSVLAFDLLASINGGRLKMYERDNTPECTEFWNQMRLARSVYRPNQTMGFYVDPSDGHDDFLMSLALLNHAAGSFTIRKAVGK